jgi:hypothetical protein
MGVYISILLAPAQEETWPYWSNGSQSAKKQNYQQNPSYYSIFFSQATGLTLLYLHGQSIYFYEPLSLPARAWSRGYRHMQNIIWSYIRFG